jgi:7-cyano-7-deazaguanine synthase
MTTKTVVAVVSGGMDSVTLAYAAAHENRLDRMVSFDYGQRHRKELAFAALHAKRLGVPHHVVDLTPITAHLKGSALTDDVAVPDGHYTETSMRATVVPNRNAIMLAIAYGIAAGHKADMVATAIHAGDHFIYPDCRPEFAYTFQAMQDMALGELWAVGLWTPFIYQSKADIVRLGASLGVPYVDTWSCYKGGDRHCGRCGTCVERAEAFHLAGVRDWTDYEDPDFWRAEVDRQAARAAAAVRLPPTEPTSTPAGGV